MKKMKLLSGLMAMTMCVTAFGISASAADVTVKIGSQTVKAGETFSVDLSLSGVPAAGINTADFAISYDPDLVDITSVELGTIANKGAAEAEGDYGDTVFGYSDTGEQIIVVYSVGLEDSKYWTTEDGVFLTITGKANASAADGSVCPLEIVAADRAAYPGGAANSAILFSTIAADGTETDYTPAVTAGAITIGSGDVVDDQTDWGNADCSQGTTVALRVNVMDAILVARVSAEDREAAITDTGKKNADVDHSGAVDGADLTRILSYLAGTITYEQMHS